jgi:hypothetical protein
MPVPQNPFRRRRPAHPRPHLAMEPSPRASRALATLRQRAAAAHLPGHDRPPARPGPASPYQSTGCWCAREAPKGEYGGQGGQLAPQTAWEAATEVCHLHPQIGVRANHVLRIPRRQRPDPKKLSRSRDQEQ